jgi:hypothetical protein
MSEFTGYYDDSLPPNWREYDERDEYREVIVTSLSPEVEAILAEGITIPF